MNIRILTAYLAQRLAGLMPNELGTQDLALLLSPRAHIALLKRRRAQMIVNRVRLMAFLFAILTPLWSIIDYLFFPLPLWLVLALMRIVAGSTFALLAFFWRPDRHMGDAYRALALLFAIPGAFYLGTQEALAYYHLQGFSEAIKAGYAFLPFVLLAGISIFPLTLVESMLVALPLLGAQAISGLFIGPMLEWPSFAGAFWLQVLISGVAILAGVSQLAFMIALFRQAIRDPLTGIFSRRSGEELLERQFQIARRKRTALSIAFVDLDRFKEINDRHGHDAGDRALIAAAAAMTKNLRDADILVRWGGEEFLLIMPDTDPAEARQALTRLQEAGFGERPDASRLTASIGYAEVGQDLCGDWRELVETADHRMYLAKSGGRNRVVFADPPAAKQ